MKKLTPFAKEQLKLLNDPNRELLDDYERFESQVKKSLESKGKSQFEEKPQLVSPVIEMSVAKLITPHSNLSDEGKALWNSFLHNKFKKVSYVKFSRDL